VLRACQDLVRGKVRAHGGRDVKSLGDGLLAAFVSSRRAYICALDIRDAVEEQGQRHPKLQVGVRTGLHTGDASQEAGDVLGSAFHAAARICAKAKGPRDCSGGTRQHVRL
jgi:class 3 adenylate cyclase